MNSFFPSSRNFLSQLYLFAVLVVYQWMPTHAQEDRVATEATNAASQERLAKDLEYLSSDSLEGRGTSTQGINLAADYIANRWSELGLKTDAFDGKPFQFFHIRGPMIVGEMAKNQLEAVGPDDEKRMAELGKDYTPVSLGKNGSFDGPVVFAGYGITALDEGRELNYDDYSGLSVVGKVVVVLRKEPQLTDPDSPFDGLNTSQYAYFATKAANAAVHGAKAMLIVNDRSTLEANGDVLPAVDGAGSSFTSSAMPTLFVKREWVENMLQKSLGKGLADLEREIDANLKPRSVELKGWRVSGQSETIASKVDVKNVIASLPGAGDLADEFVVVGAHYDHVGMGGEGSLAPGTIEVHNGADDNGSGTVCLLEVSKRLSERYLAESSEPSSRRTIVFMAFSAEEKGLLGSQHYCRNPRFPLDQTVAMVNMDMVGRMLDNQLTIYGTGTAKEFSSLIDSLNAGYRFEVEKIAAGLGPSDHASFFEVGVPVFHFFTGLHEDYHRPSDDFGKINLTGMVRITDMVTDLVHQIATAPERPTFIRAAGSAEVQMQKPKQAKMGIMVDAQSEQVVIQSVNRGGAADKAGIMPLDVVVKLGEFDIGNLQSLNAALRQFSPGDRAKVVVLRDGQSKTMDIELTK